MIRTRLIRFILIVMICSFISCGAGWMDYTEDLGEGYFYDGGNRLISPDYEFEDGIFPDVVAYNFISDYIIATQKISKFYSPFLADNITSRYRFMLYSDTINMNAYQRNFLNSFWWRDTTLRKKIAREISADNYNNITKIDSIVDSVVKTNFYYRSIIERKLNYWIIRKKDKKLFGPFSKEEYMNERHNLGIPASLEFK